MKKAVLITWIVCLTLLLCSCGWLDGEYHSVTPYLQQDEQTKQEQKVCRTYEEIRQSLVELVEGGNTKGLIYVQAESNNKVSTHMDNAIFYVQTKNAIGAYAVEEITYDIGTNAAIPAVAIQISYIHNRSEILSIKKTEHMDQAVNAITSALKNCKAREVVRVEKYDEVDLEQVIADYVDANPDYCMEQPQVSVMVFPERGDNRVIEVVFTYKTSRDVLRNMQKEIEPVFSSARLYVQGTVENWDKYAQLYSFLMERYEYTIETSITPSYSLLRHGVGDSKAFATVYGLMCRQAGLDCIAVAGTKNGEPWYWNVVCEDGVYYHIDLLECKNNGAFLPKTEEEMSGYVWDYSAFGHTPTEEPGTENA